MFYLKHAGVDVELAPSQQTESWFFNQQCNKWPVSTKDKKIKIPTITTSRQHLFSAL